MFWRRERPKHPQRERVGQSHHRNDRSQRHHAHPRREYRLCERQRNRVNHAGAAFTLNSPTSPTVTPLGPTGSTTYQYKIASVDGAGGVGAATSSFQTTTGAASLGLASVNQLSWTAPTGTGSQGVRCLQKHLRNLHANRYCRHYQLFNSGYTSFTYVDSIPTSASASSLADALVTTISSGGGTTSLTLGGSSTTAATSQGIYHDDGAAVLTALSAGPSVVFPTGTFNIASVAGLTVPANEYISGQYSGTVVRSIFAGGSVFVIAGGQRISNMILQLAPTTKEISSTLANGVYQAQLDNLSCQGNQPAEAERQQVAFT